jgi:hypothetical protein
METYELLEGSCVVVYERDTRQCVALLGTVAGGPTQNRCAIS